MSRRTVLLLLGYALVLLVAAADLAWLYPRLPERVATKFGAGGEVIGWSTRSGWLTGHLFTLGLFAVLMVGLRFGLRLIPPSLINVPHREFWLAPGRIDASLALLGDLILGLGLAILAFLVALQHLTLAANLLAEPRLGNGFWVVLGLYLAAMASGIVWLYRRFRLPR
jgi:hypothetical protein